LRDASGVGDGDHVIVVEAEPTLQLCLAAIFLVAGIAKLRDPTGTRRAVADFGLRGRLASLVAGALPVAELAVAAILVPDRTAELGAAAALILLVTFAAAITLSLLKGNAPDCNCFGQIHSEPVGVRTLIRNALLAAGPAAFFGAR
jgi:Methylamine utilisation protein MauE